jgi:hypothetical protein
MNTKYFLAILCILTNTAFVVATPSFAQKPREIITLPLMRLPLGCYTQVSKARVVIAHRSAMPVSVSLSEDWKGNHEISFSSDGVLADSSADTSEIRQAIEALGRSCPKVQSIVVDGPTGGSSRWFLRKTGFTQPHYRDSGLPSDYQRYMNWKNTPFDYNP